MEANLEIIQHEIQDFIQILQSTKYQVRIDNSLNLNTMEVFENDAKRLY